MAFILIRRVMFIALCLFSLVRLYGQPVQLPLAANVKYVDADDIGPMFSGIAVVKKGQSFGLINAEGGFVVPYNRYREIENPRWGMAAVKDAQGLGLIDSTGKEILKCNSLNRYATFTDDGYCAIHTVTNDLLLIDRKGKKLNSFKFGSLAIKGGYVYVQNKMLSYQGKIFDAGPGWIPIPRGFSEGLLITGKKNEFGETKYGAVDSNGKVAIPFTFTNAPEDFHDGLALVKPVADAEFSFAYIDKKGNVKLKVSSFPDGRTRDHAGSFIYGFARQYYVGLGAPDIYLDTSGNYKTQKEYFEFFGLDPATTSRLYTESNSFGVAVYQGAKGNGLVDLRTKEVCPAHFSFLGNAPAYDPVSGLTLGEYLDDKRNRTKGLINMKGELVILKAEKSVF